MTTALRRWSYGAIAAAMAVSAGCGQPPPMVTMTPPGSRVDPLAIDLSDENYKARALGETPVAREGSSSSGAADSGQPGDGSAAPAVRREPTEVGVEAELQNGLRYTTLEPGDPDGPEAALGDTIVVNYKGTLQDGTVFDSTEGKQPATFSLVPGGLISGWTEGIPGMKVGERRRLTVPPALGYGPSGFPPKIPPNAALTFEVELVEVRKRGG